VETRRKKGEHMQSGYCLTREGTDALEAFNDDRVRFAAALDDGSGIVAFDGGWEGFDTLGTVFMAQEPHPDYPDTWPDWARKQFPKRAIATGREHYALLKLRFAEYLSQQDAVTGIAQVTDELLLVESDGPIAAGASWSAAVSEFRDKRLELVRT
jgi:hypothetical protein